MQYPRPSMSFPARPPAPRMSYVPSPGYVAGQQARYSSLAASAAADNSGKAAVAAGAAADLISGILAQRSYTAAAKYDRLRGEIQGNKVRDDLLHGMAAQQVAASRSGFMLDGNIAVTQLADKARAQADIRSLRLQAELLAAQKERAGAHALVSGIVRAGTALATGGFFA